MLEPSLLTIFIAHNVNRVIAGYDIPPSSFYGILPAYIVIQGFFLSNLWKRLAVKNKDFSIPSKFSAALFAVGIGYWILVLGISLTNPHHLLSAYWILIAYFF